MRPYLQIFALMLSMLATTISLNAQHVTQPLNSGYWSFGLNSGKAYQSSDLDASSSGFGIGATIGKNIYHQPGAVLDFGLRSRLNYSQTKGLSPTRNFNIKNNTAVNGEEGLNYLPEGGFIFSNHKTNLVDAGLEGILTFNELKEKTGIKLSIFGGLSGAIYNVRTDQADRSGNNYAEGYANVNHRSPTREIKRELRNAILDGTYESQADGFDFGARAGIMSTIGAEVGFQVNPKFSIDLGHRTTFSGTDLLDGERWMDSDNDILHYTYLGANVNINKREKSYHPPIITIVQPGAAIAVDVPRIEIFAKVKNVEHSADIEILVNGQSRPFNFRKERLTATVSLNEGENDIEIIAGNYGGEDRQVVRAFYEKRRIVVPTPPVREVPPPAPTVYRPVVKIINANQTIREDRIIIEGRVKHVEYAEDIQLLVNGRNERFRFDAYHQKVEATIYLLPGKNDIILRAFNEAGETTDRTIIIFEDRIPAPTVEITQPETQFRTGKNTVKLVAQTEFISDRRDIILTVNGRKIPHYDFSNGCLTKTVRLVEGRNIINIRVDNPTGYDETKVVVFHRVVQPELREPVVKILSPKDHTTFSKKRVELVANITEVQRKRNIELILNDVKITDFDFNGSTLRANLNLKKGSNKITLRASNPDGRDAQTVAVKFEPKESVAITAKPTIQIAKPKNNLVVDKAFAKLEATIIGATDVEVFVNGEKLTNVSPRNNKLTTLLKLKKGQNKVAIKATNRGGTTTKNVTITFRENTQAPIKNVEKDKKIITPVPPTPTTGGTTVKGTKINKSKKGF